MGDNKLLWGLVLVIAISILFFAAVSYSTGGISSTAAPSYESKVVGVTCTVFAAEVSGAYKSAVGASSSSGGSSSGSSGSNDVQNQLARNDLMRHQTENTIHNTRSGGMYF
jgi:hypothetical protein